MLDQLIIGTKASFDDFGASVASRTIQPPSKKTIKETVPFSNVTYDFSKINGELFWNERVLEYVFEIIADNPESLERKKADFSKWVMNVMNEKIHDPYEPDFHYIGTYDNLNYEDEDCVEKTTATVNFTAYPYKIANKATNHICTIAAASEKVFVIDNESAHRITPTITTDQEILIKFDGVSYSATAGTFTDNVLKLKAGKNTLIIENLTDSECVVTVSYFEEVF